MATKISEIITVEYWGCLNPAHRHRSESIANSCIGWAEKQKRSLLIAKFVRESDLEITKLVLNGSSFTEVAKKNGLTPPRVRMILAKTCRLANREAATQARSLADYRRMKDLFFPIE